LLEQFYIVLNYVVQSSLGGDKKKKRGPFTIVYAL
jgi:hypothetical protein